MREFRASEAKHRFGEILDLAERGEEILITRNGKAVAKLVAVRGVFDREDARLAAAEIREMRKGVRLGGAGVKELIDEGRE